jgi:hypothetical protein
LPAFSNNDPHRKVHGEAAIKKALDIEGFFYGCLAMDFAMGIVV